jgi:hypothetical protein
MGCNGEMILGTLDLEWRDHKVNSCLDESSRRQARERHVNGQDDNVPDRPSAGERVGER